jgi:hypothetical protein
MPILTVVVFTEFLQSLAGGTIGRRPFKTEYLNRQPDTRLVPAVSPWLSLHR